MKNIKLIFGLSALLAALTLNAQNIPAPSGLPPMSAVTPPITNNPAPTASPESFMTTAFNWLTVVNTNMHTFDHNRGVVWTGPVLIKGDTVANALAGEYNFTNSSFYLQGIALNAGIAGTFLGGEANLGYHVVKHNDVDLSIGAGAGWMRDLANIENESFRPLGDVYGQILKAFGVNSAGGIRLEEQITGRKMQAPLVYLVASAEFN